MGNVIMPRISILTAVFNEDENLPEFRRRVTSLADDSTEEFEFVVVDDHSSDKSQSLTHAWANVDSRVTYIRLSRNCGSHAAFSAALAHCTGDCAILLAADMQDPPEVSSTLIAKWMEGYDVVWAARSLRESESWWTQFSASMYYRLMRLVALPDMPKKGADFLLMDRKVIDAYNAIPEKNTSFLAMILWMGFRQTTIQYIKQARNAGTSKWTLSKKIKLLVDSMVSFSYVPIRFMSLFGFMMAAAGFLYGSFVLVGRLTGLVAAGTGFAALMTVLLVGQGAILLMLGVLGEYLWRTFDEARGRPRYIIEEFIESANSSTGSQVQRVHT